MASTMIQFMAVDPSFSGGTLTRLLLFRLFQLILPMAFTLSPTTIKWPGPNDDTDVGRAKKRRHRVIRLLCSSPDPDPSGFNVLPLFTGGALG